MKYLLLYFPIAVFVFSGCGGKKEESKSTQLPEVKTELNIAIGTGRIEPMDKVVMLGAEVGGTVSHLIVQPGDFVKQGAPLIQLQDETEQAQLQQVLAQLTSQRNALAVAEAQAKLAENDADYAKTEAERIERLKKNEATTEQVLREARNLSRQTSAKLEAATQTVLQNKSKIMELEAQLSFNRTLVAKKRLLAPSDGQILSVEVRKGQYLSPGLNAIEFAPAGALSVWTEIDELLADQLKVGQAAVIRPQGATDTLSMAQVVFIAPALRKKSLFSDQSDNLEDRRVREVRVKLLNPKPGLLTGSRVECVIQLK